MRKHIIKFICKFVVSVFLLPALYDVLSVYLDVSKYVENVDGARMSFLQSYMSLSQNWWYPWIAGCLLGYFGGEITEWVIHRRTHLRKNESETFSSLFGEIQSLSKAISDSFSADGQHIDLKLIARNNPALEARIRSLLIALSELKIPTPDYSGYDAVAQNVGYHLYFRNIAPFAQKGQLLAARSYASNEIEEFRAEAEADSHSVLAT